MFVVWNVWIWNTWNPRITDSNARGSVMAASTKRAHAAGVETDVKKAPGSEWETPKRLSL